MLNIMLMRGVEAPIFDATRALLLQGFPPDYELLGSLSAQISQVSEAVPPPLAQAIAISVMGDLAYYRRQKRQAA
jgi:site-specific DNA-cytosine methylase